MSHIYPIAASARDALKTIDKMARTLAEAQKVCGTSEHMSLKSEWLTLAVDEIDDVLALVDANPACGFVQSYEDADGNTVLAITYWNLERVDSFQPSPVEVTPESPDHTDDLYFRRTTSNRRRKPKSVDTRQLDMFAVPKSD